MKIVAASTSLLVSFFLPLNAFASSCKDYPSKNGATVIPQEKGPKIISTYQVSVPFDDADEVMDAYAEAKAEAKAQIAEFMQTKIAKDCERKTNKLSRTLMSKDPEGNESKSVNIEKIKTTLCSTVESTEAILNGVVDVGRCYTPGKFVKVTIGIKPETIVSASRLNQNMKNSRNNSGSGFSSNNSGSNSSGFNSMDGYSDYNSDF